jgi:hypothetical protein
MDRSYLSQPEVIAASRDFVCVRLMTYEDPFENAFLKAFDITRSGEVENTTFTILAPDGKKPLVRATRSAKGAFRDAPQMAESMARIARQYPGKPATADLPPLPTVATVRLAVDVAAADNQPLVIVVAEDEAVRRQLTDRLRPLAWGERYRGRFTYAAAAGAKDLAVVDGSKPVAGILVVEPSKFGLSATILTHVVATASADELAGGLADGLAKFHRTAAEHGSHVRSGKQQGAFWDTALPVTDPQEKRARESGRSPRPE